jgi:flagellar biosynthetic protein FliP
MNAISSVIPEVNFSIGANGDGTASALQMMFLFIMIALIPTILLMMTCFTRIIIILHFMRAALATQQMPPNTVLIGIALVLSMFIMAEPLERIFNEAYLPFQAGEISADAFADRLLEPLRDYMLTMTDPDDIGLFGRIAGHEFDTGVIRYTPDEIPLMILVPAHMLSELRTGFTAGFAIYLPFIVIDMVVASTLMAMGMMMLPPAMISMPFKLMVFVLSNGWRMLVEAIVTTF